MTNAISGFLPAFARCRQGEADEAQQQERSRGAAAQHLCSHDAVTNGAESNREDTIATRTRRDTLTWESSCPGYRPLLTDG